jgi:HlyD family secretion protein
LTWVVTAEGSSVRKGDMVARVADLSAFRVEATVSDVHAARVTPGMPAIVRIGNEQLTGVVHAVRPAVENGVVGFDIALDSPSDPRLRPNLRVDVQAVTAIKPDALRLARGTYEAPDGSQCAFVLRGDRAVRTRIRLGVAGYDMFEIVDGLHEGDEVIVSDTSSFMHHQEVGLR